MSFDSFTIWGIKSKIGIQLESQTPDFPLFEVTSHLANLGTVSAHSSIVSPEQCQVKPLELTHFIHSKPRHLISYWFRAFDNVPDHWLDGEVIILLILFIGTNLFNFV